MTSPHRPTPRLPEHLQALYDRFPFERSLRADPVEGVRRQAGRPAAAEVAGIFAATLAIGNTTAIRRSFDELERRIRGDWLGFVERAGSAEIGRALRGFRHRWIRGDQLRHLAGRLAVLRASHGSLESVFVGGLSQGGFRGGLTALSDALRGPGGAGTPRGYAALFPRPDGPGRSACKRLTLYVRWMVRREFPDLGLWRRVDPAELRIPLDQHVFWIAYHLGLTARRTRSWAAVEEVTAALRAVDPADPVRFDFVLCHTGISGDCPKRRDLTVCGACAVRPDCLMWQRPTGAAT